MATIPDLRHRAWSLGNNAVLYNNKMIDILYQDMNSKPNHISKVDEEKTNDYSFAYIQELIVKSKINLDILKSRAEFIDSIYKKHKELSDKFNSLERV